jgi:hypothetical protein
MLASQFDAGLAMIMKAASAKKYRAANPERFHEPGATHGAGIKMKSAKLRAEEPKSDRSGF